MVNVNISTMRVFGPLALLSGLAISKKWLPVPNDLFYYAILAADVMVVTFWIFDEINNYRSKRKDS